MPYCNSDCSLTVCCIKQCDDDDDDVSVEVVTHTDYVCYS